MLIGLTNRLGKIKHNYIKWCNSPVTPLFVLTLLLSSCFLSQPKSNRSQEGVSNNSPLTVSKGYGRILRYNPIILSGDENLSTSTKLGSLLTLEQDFITFNSTLLESCGKNNISDCYKVFSEANAAALSPVNERWAFDPNITDETDSNYTSFLQVHTFGHTKNMITKFQDYLTSFYDLAKPSIDPSSSSTLYQSSIPSSLFTSKANWRGSSTLVSYSNCDSQNNSFYSPANFSLCYGKNSTHNNIFFAQDPSIIYHELGHTFADVIMNMRNVSAGKIERSQLGVHLYDEAGSIGEGLSDYHSYIINKRTRFAEWALGRFFKAARPVKETDDLHAVGIDATSDSRLSYPAYLNYDPNNLGVPVEDIHMSGMIVSHYLVALTEDLVSTCSMTNDDAIKSVYRIITESLAELGDLTAKGNDFKSNYVNLDSTNSSTWIKVNNPINFRSFFQRFSKYLYLIFNQQKQCNGVAYSKDKIEKLLDNYGLLLFNTYNEDGNGTTDGNNGTHTSIDITNRTKTQLVSKELLSLNSDNSLTTAYIFDNRNNMRLILANLQAGGQIGQLSSQIASTLPYNNGNGQISPGEFFGISFNLKNTSNTPMAGVQIIGNDWDHVNSAGKPCNNRGDNFPNADEGGVDCGTVNSYNSTTTAPVCLVQYKDENSTQWLTQEKAIEKLDLDPSKCLGGSLQGENCLIRAVKGADNAYFSKMDPGKTWVQTVTPTGKTPEFTYSNIVFFEANTYITPGTTFRCRMRARFTNCKDCFSDPTKNGGDDFLDHEYNGSNPFKIINFQFTVTN